MSKYWLVINGNNQAEPYASIDVLEVFVMLAHREENCRIELRDQLGKCIAARVWSPERKKWAPEERFYR